MFIQKALFHRQYIAGIIASIIVAASATSFGWVAPTMKYFTDDKNVNYMTSSEISWMIAIIEVGNLISPLPFGILADKIGRKPSILIAGPMLTISWIVLLFTTSYTIICIMRVIQGLAMGIVFTVVPLYLGEISSLEKRGSISSLFYSAWFFGYLLDYCLGPYVSYKLFTAFNSTLPMIFTILFFMQPESPYFLMMKGKEEKAAATLTWLRNGSSEEDLKKELENIKLCIEEDLKQKPKLGDVIHSSADRRALLIIIIIGCIRIFSGGIAIMSYSTQLFKQSGNHFVSPDTLTIIMGLVTFLGGFVNTSVVDSLGRRPLLFLSCIGSFFSMLSVGIYFYFESEITTDIVTYSWIVPLAIILYCMFSVVGIYPVSATYTSELFTTKTKGVAAGISAINITICSFLCIKLYQIIGDSYGLYTIYLLFSVVCLLGLISLYILAPETKGKTFSQIRNELSKSNTVNKQKLPEQIIIVM